MKMNEVFKSRFLKADDCPTPRLFTIAKLTVESVKNEDGESEKPCLWFEEVEQGMVVNRTNWTALMNITGHDDSDDWLGKQIVVVREMVQFGSRTVPALRVKRPKTKAPQPAVEVDFDDEIP